MKIKGRIWLISILCGFFLMLIVGGIIMSNSASSQSGPAVFEITEYKTYQFNVLKGPSGLALIPNTLGGTSAYSLFIADSGNHVIREFRSTAQNMIIVAGSLGNPGDADGNPGLLNFPTGLTGSGFGWFDCSGGGGPRSECIAKNYKTIYINDSLNHKIKKVCTGSPPSNPPASTNCSNQLLTTVAGNGSSGFTNSSSLNASFGFLAGLTKIQGTYYIADAENNAIRMWDGSNVSTLAGNGAAGFIDGQGSSACFFIPGKVVSDGQGNLYVADIGNNAVRKIDTSGNVSTLSGKGFGEPGYNNNNNPSEATFNRPTSVVYNLNDGSVYVADSHNNCIRRIDPNGAVTTYAGSKNPGYVNGSLTDARFNTPTDLVIYNGVMFISDSLNNCIRAIDMSSGQVSTFIN